MRSLFVVFVVTLLAMVASFTLLESGDGYVLVALAGYTVEMPFLVGLLLVLALCVCFYFTIGMLRLLLDTRRSVVGWAVRQRQQKGLSRTTQGLIAFIEGRWDFSRRSLAKAADDSSTPLINYLFAARASSALGDTKAVDNFLKQAELSTQGADVAIGLTQAELQIQSCQYEQALATLLRVKKRASNHSVVLKLLARVYSELNDWSSLIALLPSIYQAHGKVFNDAEVAEIERLACHELLASACNKGGYEGLTNGWKQLPSALKKRAVIVADYAGQLIKLEHLVEAEALLRHQLHRDYDSSLIEIYGRALAEKPDKQLAYASKLLTTQASDPALLIALARICMRLDRLDQAQEYLLQSLALQKQAVTYAELASVYAVKGDYRASADAYACGAALQIGADRPLLLASASASASASA